MPYAERLRWFEALREWIVPTPREAIRALVIDAAERVLLMRFENPANGDVWWATPGGGIDEGESDEVALRRELLEETCSPSRGRSRWFREHVLPWDRHLWRQRERFQLIRIEHHDVVPTIDLVREHVYGHRWWTLDELEQSDENLAPRALATNLRAFLRDAKYLPSRSTSPGLVWSCDGKRDRDHPPAGRLHLGRRFDRAQVVGRSAPLIRTLEGGAAG